MVSNLNNDDISTNELFTQIRKIFSFIFKYWLAILIGGILGGSGGYLISRMFKPKYTADLSFVLSAESKTAGLSSLASQFGIDFGSSSSNDVFSGENIITLFKSKKMIKSVLFKKPPASGTNLINLLVTDLKWDKKWSTKERTKNMYPFPDDAEKLSPVQDSLFREVHTLIVTKLMSVSRPDKKLSVYQLATTSTNPIFSCYLTKYLMDETARFYIETKTSISRINLTMLQNEADSLRRLLGYAISSTASEAQRTFNLNPALQAERAPAQKSQVRATVLATAYGEVVKNLEIAKVTYQRERPLYQIIDEPTLPLKVKKTSGLLWALAGSIIGGLLMMLVILIKNKK